MVSRQINGHKNEIHIKPYKLAYGHLVVHLTLELHTEYIMLLWGSKLCVCRQLASYRPELYFFTIRYSQAYENPYKLCSNWQVCVTEGERTFFVSLTLSTHFHLISFHIVSCLVVSCRAVPYRIVSYHIIYHIISYHIISYHIISHHITSHNTTQHNTTHHTTSHHITSHHSTAQHSTAQHSTWRLPPLQWNE